MTIDKEVTMSWEIRVWHEDVSGGARLCIEASPEVPDEVISSVAGSYWFEEVQYAEEEWEEGAFAEEGDGPAGHLHG
jgi:hypothetical protein